MDKGDFNTKFPLFIRGDAPIDEVVISYDYLCTAFDFHKLWKKEFECEGRDYVIGMRLP